MSDVKQAAERLHKHYTASSREQSPYWHDRGIDQQIEDEQAIVDNAVAEHDPTPIDAEWLGSVGGQEISTGFRYERNIRLKVYLIRGTACEGPKCWDWRVIINGSEILNPTRGQVRKLLAALE